MARTSSLIVLVQPILHRVSCSDETNPKCNQIVRNKLILEFRVQWGGSGAFVAKKIQCDLMAQTCPLIAPVQPISHWVSCSNETIQNAPKHYKTQQIMSLASNGVDWVRSLRKTLMWFRRTNFFINAPVQPILHRVPCSNETLPNAPKHYEMLQNMSLVPMGWIECVLCE